MSERVVLYKCIIVVVVDEIFSTFIIYKRLVNMNVFKMGPPKGGYFEPVSPPNKSL